MSDLLCPWCGGELPGEPGQFVKCRHCASDIYWGDNKPWRNKMQAANASQVHPTELSPTVEDTAPTPSESDFVPAESLPLPVPLVVDDGLQNLPLSWAEKLRLKSIARKRLEAEAKLRLTQRADVSPATWIIAYRFAIVMMGLCFLVILLPLMTTSLANGDSDSFAIFTGLMIYFVTPVLVLGIWGYSFKDLPEDDWPTIVITPENLSELNNITLEVAEAFVKHGGVLILVA